jgi:sialic acid synthase SpsE
MRERPLVSRSLVKIGDRLLGDGLPCFITFEAGPTHNKALMRHGPEAGADAVKFQIVDPNRLVADRALPFSYEVLVDRATGRTETVTKPLYDILCRRTLNDSEWGELKRYIDSLGLTFVCTILFEDEVDFVAGLGCHSIKIASPDSNRLARPRGAIGPEMYDILADRRYKTDLLAGHLLTLAHLG